MDIRLEKDSKVYKNYIIVKDLDKVGQTDLARWIEDSAKSGALKEKDVRFNDFISHLKSGENSDALFPVAQRAEDAVIVLGKTQIVFEKSKASEVREFLKDTAQYTHKHIIKTAEYHTYTCVYPVNDKDSKIYFGGAVTPKSGFTGRLYVRNDDYYDLKYFKGDKFRDESNQNPHFDRGSISIEFDITAKQFKSGMLKLDYDKEALWKKSAPFNFVGIRGDNCADYANEMFKFLGFQDNFSDYYRIDQLDDRDMGILYYQYTHNIEYIPFNIIDIIDQASSKFLGAEASKVAHNALIKVAIFSPWLYSQFNYFQDSKLHIKAYKNDVTYFEDKEADLNVRVVNKFGETALHTALSSGSFEFAERLLDLGADVDVKDLKGHSSLFVCAGLKASLKKHKILERVIKLAQDVDSEDEGGYYTPLSAAVKSNDAVAVKMLIDNGAYVGYINSVKDNLVDVALLNKSYDVIKVLNEYDSSLIYFDNLEHQIPIATIYNHPNKKEILPEIDSLWDAFDKSLVKTDADLLHAKWIGDV